LDRKLDRPQSRSEQIITMGSSNPTSWSCKGIEVLVLFDEICFYKQIVLDRYCYLSWVYIYSLMLITDNFPLSFSGMFASTIYEGEYVNMSQMDIKRNTCDIPAWEKHLFLAVSFTSIDTHVPSLQHCVETHSIEVFWLLSQSLPHLRFNLLFIAETFSRPTCEQLYATNTSHRKQGKKILYEYPLHWVLSPTEIAQQNVARR
jgi:hypothetical protein